MHLFYMILCVYVYLHYGMVLFMASFGVYKGHLKALLLNLIPFYWVYIAIRDFKEIIY